MASVFDFIKEPVRAVVRNKSVPASSPIPSAPVSTPLPESQRQAINLKNIQSRGEELRPVNKTFGQKVLEKTPQFVQDQVRNISEGLFGSEEVDLAGETRQKGGLLVRGEDFDPLSYAGFGWLRPKAELARFNQKREDLIRRGVSSERATDIAIEMGNYNKPGQSISNKVLRNTNRKERIESLGLNDDEKQALTASNTSDYIDAALNSFDLVGVGSIARPLAKGVFEKIAKEASEQVIEGILRKELPDLSDDAYKVFSAGLKHIDKAEDVESVFNRINAQIGQNARRTAAAQGGNEVINKGQDTEKALSFISSTPVPETTAVPVKSFISKPISEIVNPSPTLPAASQNAGGVAKSDVLEAGEGGAGSLAEEARKYKSVEEFVKSQQAVYRGGDANIDVTRGANRGISVSKDKAVADTFIAPEKGVVGEAYLSPNAKVLKESDIPKNLQNSYIDSARRLANPDNFSKALQRTVIEKQQAIIEYARKNGYDAVDFPFENEIRIVKPNTLKTKEQLTDIYNQATKGIIKDARADASPVGQYIPDRENIFKETPEEVTSTDLRLEESRLERHPAKPFLKYVNKMNGLLPEIIEGYEGVYGRKMKELLEKKQITFDEAQELVDDYVSKEKNILEMQRKNIGLTDEGKFIESAEIDETGELRPISDYLDGRFDEVGKDTGAKKFEEIIDEASDIPASKKVNILDYVRTPDRVLNKVGLADEARLIRKKYDDYLSELPKNIEKIKSWKERVPGEKANRDIFMYLDGNLYDGQGFARQLYGEELKVANEIKAWFQEWANRLELPADKRIASYITHLFEDDFIKKEFDPDLAKLIADKIPGEVYDPFLQQRLGTKGYKRDTWAALDAYVKRATRKVHMDVALKRLQIAAEDLPLEVTNYVKSYADRINMRPTQIDSLVDNFIKSSPVGYKLGQRPVASISRTLRQMVYRGTLGLNVGSAVRNLSQVANTYAKLGEVYTIKGATDFILKGSKGIKELEDNGILRNNFIEDRTISATKEALEKADKVLFSLFDAAEKINRGTSYFGAKAKALAEGMTEREAIEYAKDVVRDTQFTFGSVDTPVAMQSDIVKFLTQFQSYTVKQIEFLAEMLQNKNYIGMLRYSIAMIAFMATIGNAISPVRLEWSDGIIPKLKVDWPIALKSLWSFINIPFPSYDDFGNPTSLSDRTKEFLETLVPLVPAGVQIKKTAEGVKSIMQGGVYDDKGNLKYTQDDSLWGKIQTIVFGSNVSKNAKSYFDEQERKEDLREQILPIYLEAKDLKDEGKTEEANALVNELTDEEYEMYKQIKSQKVAERTIELKKEMLPVYFEAQKLKKAGDDQGAQTLVNQLTDEQYEAYTKVKKDFENAKKAEEGKKPEFGDTVIEERNLIELVGLYAQAIGTDPINAFKGMLTDEKIEYVEGNLVKFYRADLTDTNQVKEKQLRKQGIDLNKKGEYNLDHIVPLTLGGDNSERNLVIVPADLNQKVYAPVETKLGQALREKKITRKEAREFLHALKAGETTAYEVLSNIN